MTFPLLLLRKESGKKWRRGREAVFLFPFSFLFSPPFFHSRLCHGVAPKVGQVLETHFFFFFFFSFFLLFLVEGGTDGKGSFRAYPLSPSLPPPFSPFSLLSPGPGVGGAVGGLARPPPPPFSPPLGRADRQEATLKKIGGCK